MPIDEQQRNILVKRLEDLDVDGVREKLDYITWLYGWHSAVETLRCASEEQRKASDADIDRILSEVFHSIWPPTSNYSMVIKHLTKCPESSDFDEVLKWATDSKKKFTKRRKIVEKKEAPKRHKVIEKKEIPRKVDSPSQKSSADNIWESMYEIKNKESRRLGDHGSYHTVFLNARNLAMMGHFAEAELEIRKAIEIRGDSPAYLMLGVILAQQAKLEESNEAIRQAITLDPKCGSCWVTLGRQLLSTYNLVESEEAFERVKELSPELLQEEETLLRELVKRKQNDPRWLYGCSVVLRLQGKTSEAKKFLDMAIDSDVGYLFLKCERPDIAEKYAKRAVRRNPDNPELLCILGVSLSQQDKDKLAEKHFRKALEIDPELPHAWIGLSIALEKQMKVEEAAEAARMAKKFEGRQEMYFSS